MRRSPAIWLHPNSYKLHVRLSDCINNNTGYDPPNFVTEAGKTYDIKFQAIDGIVSLFIDGKLLSTKGSVAHRTRFQAPCFVGDPWYDAANATVQDLKIYIP